MQVLCEGGWLRRRGAHWLGRRALSHEVARYNARPLTLENHCAVGRRWSALALASAAGTCERSRLRKIRATFDGMRMRKAARLLLLLLIP